MEQLLNSFVKDWMSDIYKIVLITDNFIELQPITFDGKNSFFPADFGKNIKMEQFWDFFENCDKKNLQS